MSKSSPTPYIVGFVSGLIVTGLVLTNLDAELVGRLQRRVADDMVRVAAGPFSMGCDPAANWNCLPEEEPAQVVDVGNFEIDRYEVSAAEYQACVDAGVCFYRGSILDQRRTFQNSRGNHPINFVSWVEAHTFCVWRGKRLPTDAEWEKAARGPESFRFPWGNEPMPSCDLAIVDEDTTADNGTEGCSTGATWPVGSRPKGVSPYGIHDLIGNVWEWTAMGTVRGSSFSNHGAGIQFVSRFEGNRLSDRSFDVGFRCARDSY